MPSVIVGPKDSLETAVRRLKRSTEKNQLVTDVRRHEYYEKPAQRRKRKKLAAIKRAQKQVLRAMPSRERNKPRDTKTREGGRPRDRDSRDSR